MARQKEHPVGKLVGLSLPDLPVLAEPAAYLTTAWYQADPEQWRLDDMLTIACFGPPCTYLLLAIQDSPAYTRYLMATIVLVAILSARVVARSWSSLTRYRRESTEVWCSDRQVEFPVSQPGAPWGGVDLTGAEHLIERSAGLL